MTWDDGASPPGPRRCGQLSPAERRRLARSFGPVAETYERVRPDYPAEAVAWTCGDARRVVDVGAGTGKMTRALLATGCAVTAVEPDPLMRERFTVALPGTRVLPGTGEHLPLADRSVDAVVFAQSWHWTDPVVASVEAGRVLVDDGVLGLVWNTRDQSVAWVGEMNEVWGVTNGEAITRLSEPPFGAPFSRSVHRTWSWTQEMTVEEVVALAGSRSTVSTLPPRVREERLADLQDLLTTHPDLVGRATVPMPYLTDAWRVTR